MSVCGSATRTGVPSTSIVSLLYVLVNLLIDLSYVFLDPRIRY